MKSTAAYHFDLAIAPGEDEEWERIAALPTFEERRKAVKELALDALTSGGLCETKVKVTYMGYLK